jgi:hypothetical protein
MHAISWFDIVYSHQVFEHLRHSERLLAGQFCGHLVFSAART